MSAIAARHARFNYRVAAVFIHDGHALLSRDDAIWTLPGGRPEIYETSHDAIVREMHEEMGLRVEIQRLLWVVENFFVYEGEGAHELTFYYLMKLPAESGYDDVTQKFTGFEGSLPIVFRWFPVDALSDVPPLPNLSPHVPGRSPGESRACHSHRFLTERFANGGVSTAMIAFDRGGARFNYRVAGVCINQGHTLLQEFRVDHDQRETDVFWALPGGRAELLESSRDALAREMREEMGLAVEIGPLLWFVENFFTYDGKEFHELAVYYRILLPEGCSYLDVSRDFMGMEDMAPITFRWFPVDRLSDVTLHPSFLRTSLADLLEHPVHLIHRDS